jgi:hypothetical protein
MRKEQRVLARMELDRRQRWFRLAGEQNWFQRGWLKAVREALGIPVTELTAKLDIHPSVFFRMEEREAKKRVTLASLDRMAGAMGCKVVYAIVPKQGTLAEMGFDREWEKKRRRSKRRE